MKKKSAIRPGFERLTALRAQYAEQEVIKKNACEFLSECERNKAAHETNRDQADAALGRLHVEITKEICAVHERQKEILKRGGMKLERQALAGALADVQEKARAMGETFEAVRRDANALAKALGAAQKAADMFCDDRLSQEVTKGGLYFKFYLMHAASCMPHCKAPYVTELKPYVSNFPLPKDIESKLGVENDR